MLKPVPKPKWITFDCYGTLVQWHLALQTAVATILADHSEAVNAARSDGRKMVDELRAIFAEQQDRPPYRDYKTILRSSLTAVLARHDLSPRDSDGETLLSCVRDIPPHPEVPAALKRLRAQFRLAIISNTDDDLIAGTVASIGVPIDFVVTAQQARAYKPDHRLFRHAHAVIGVTPEETVHVAMGQVTDLKVCRELGIRAVWIDRSGEPLNPDWAPEAVLPDLSSLPELLATAV